LDKTMKLTTSKRSKMTTRFAGEDFLFLLANDVQCFCGV